MSDDELEKKASEALVRSGDLLPDTEDEVLRAEQDGVEFEGELPESLQELRPRDDESSQKTDKSDEDEDKGEEDDEDSEAEPESRADVVDLEAERAKRSFWTHLLAGAVGAAAAAAIIAMADSGPEVGGTMPSSEPPRPTVDAGVDAPLAPIVIGPARTCPSSCCAGSQCSAAKGELAECSSGRKCIACDFEELAKSRYRFRVGSFAPTDTGRKWIEQSGSLSLCVRVGSSERVCTPAHAGTDGSSQWATLPLVASAQDLLAGMALEVRAGNTTIGEWVSPVRINATVLCRGLFIKPKTKAGDVLGTVSAFMDEAHYVEVQRSGDVAELRARGRALQTPDLTPRIFETRETGGRRFALVLGPLDDPAAQRVRWELLAGGADARVVLGDDYEGEPMTVSPGKP